MSDNVPVEIQLEIMKLLPVKSLIQFRSVSKTWNSCIKSSDFINKHLSYHRTQVHHLLVRYREFVLNHRNYEEVDRDDTYVSIVDDDTFPTRKVLWSVPILVKLLENPRVIGTSHGLMCLHSGARDVAFIWNISIRKVVVVVVPPDNNEYIHGTFLGFGVCRETNDPKIVKITFDHDEGHPGIGEERVYRPPKVAVFTLSIGAWRSSYGNLPRESIQFCYFHGVAVDGVYYWLAKDRIASDDDRSQYIIISYDMTSEEFGEVTLPRSLILVSMSKLGESLVVVGPDKHASYLGYDVWMLGDGVPKSFTKIFTFTQIENTSVRGFRKSGEPILVVRKLGYEHRERGELVVYNHCSKRINKLSMKGLDKSFEVFDYTETLLLVDKPNFMVYNEIVKVES